MNKKLVCIVMGSDSDLKSMQEASKVLKEFGVPHEITVNSAHRSPDLLTTYVHQSEKNGTKVFIAGAGGAAHLAGVVASLTTIPVIGVPIRAKSLDGLDSLLSMVQMPQGVPVATVAIDGAFNAGLLAIQILALSDEKLHNQLRTYKENLSSKVKEKAEKLERMGIDAYIASMK